MLAAAGEIGDLDLFLDPAAYVVVVEGELTQRLGAYRDRSAELRVLAAVSSSARPARRPPGENPALGHKELWTAKRYNQRRGALEGSPAYGAAASMAEELEVP
ncbi:hypothetical protein [Streptomyces cucumeris]|uniref:hypothetical protein n=1 Tax=Streptomyces cucumeris TaxID=2962890 RepID=UPI003D71D3AE